MRNGISKTSQRFSRLTTSQFAFVAVVYFVVASLLSAFVLSNDPLLSNNSLPLRLYAKNGSNSGHLLGPTDRLQLLTLQTSKDGLTIDQTRSAKYSAKPAGVVSVDSSGTVIPLANGKVEISATFGGAFATASVSVKQFDSPPPINFRNNIVPVFTKFGCNAGGCHGKSGGQNGFALSLLGFEPEDDYQFVVKEGRGRRVFPAAPKQSLLLQKASGSVPHGGGALLEKAGYEYRLIEQWIAQGLPLGEESDPVVTEITVFPSRAKLSLDGLQQLQVTAHLSDGSKRDVTNQAQFEVNNTELAETTDSGIVKIKNQAGIVAVMIRFQDHATAFLATIPLGAPIGDLPPENTMVDIHVFEKLKELGLPPSELSTDSVFIRRVTLDIAGRLPTADESIQFLDSQDPGKRKALVDRLLDSEDYANYFAQKWTSILRNRVVQNEPRGGNFLFHDWIRESLAENRPFDEFVTQLISASGDVRTNPAVNWQLKFKTMDERAEDTAQVFLGQRIQCAKCHHHPYEKWSQEDYWRFAAFYANVSQKTGRRVYTRPGTPQARNTRDNKFVMAAGLGAKPLEKDSADDARIALANWLTSSQNPYFAKMLVNRYWKHFFGVGIVEPEDDIRKTNPPSNPELLSALEKRFIESGFDLKDLIRTICNSSSYQLSANPNQFNKNDKQSFSKFNPRRLPAEVMLDSIDTFLGSKSNFRGLPAGTKATRIPDHGMANNSFLDTFGRPAGASACECERSDEITMAQCLQLLNSDDMYQKLGSSFVNEFARNPAFDSREKIKKLHLHAFSREPRPKEYNAYEAYLKSTSPGKEDQAFQDIMWTIVNTKEFLFNH